LAARHPDPAADTGRHTIRFAVGRHQPATLGSGPDAVLSTACAADALFAPVPTTGAGAARPSPFVLEHPGSLCPAWILPSETGSGYVIRLHETAGRRGTAELRLAKPAGAVTLVDFREQQLGAPRPADQMAYAIDYAPYQVVSILVRAP
jgi:alpha-mannosidase